MKSYLICLRGAYLILKTISVGERRKRRFQGVGFLSLLNFVRRLFVCFSWIQWPSVDRCMTGVWHQVTSIWFTGSDHFRREEGCGKVKGSVSPELTALAHFSTQSRCTPQVPGVQPRIPRDLQHLPQSHWHSRSNQESLTANMGSSVPGKQQRPALVERETAPNHLISISIPIITLWTPFWVLFDFLLWSCAALIWTRTRPPSPTLVSGIWLVACGLSEMTEASMSQRAKCFFSPLKQSLWSQKCSFASCFLPKHEI